MGFAGDYLGYNMSPPILTLQGLQCRVEGMMINHYSVGFINKEAGSAIVTSAAPSS